MTDDIALRERLLRSGWGLGYPEGKRPEPFATEGGLIMRFIAPATYVLEGATETDEWRWIDGEDRGFWVLGPGADEEIAATVRPLLESPPYARALAQSMMGTKMEPSK